MTSMSCGVVGGSRRRVASEVVDEAVVAEDDVVAVEAIVGLADVRDDRVAAGAAEDHVAADAGRDHVGAALLAGRDERLDELSVGIG